MGIEIIDTNYKDQGPQTEISWNGQFIGGWDNQKTRIPDEIRPLLAKIMTDIWFNGYHSGVDSAKAEFRKFIGV